MTKPTANDLCACGLTRSDEVHRCRGAHPYLAGCHPFNATKPTVERTPVWKREAVVMGDAIWAQYEIGVIVDTVAVPEAVEEAIRTQEADRWREAVREIANAVDEVLEIGVVQYPAIAHTALRLALDAHERRLRALVEPQETQG